MKARQARKIYRWLFRNRMYGWSCMGDSAPKPPWPPLQVKYALQYWRRHHLHLPVKYDIAASIAKLKSLVPDSGLNEAIGQRLDALLAEFRERSRNHPWPNQPLMSASWFDWDAKHGFTNAPANAATTTKSLDIEKMLKIGRQFKQETADSVAKFRASATPCSLCGHVMEMSDDGNEIEVCPCVYHELQKLSKFREPGSIFSGDIGIRVVNTEKCYGPSKLEDLLPLKRFLDYVYDKLNERIKG